MAELSSLLVVAIALWAAGQRLRTAKRPGLILAVIEAKAQSHTARPHE